MKLLILIFIVIIDIIISKKSFSSHKNRLKHSNRINDKKDIFCCGLDLKPPVKEVKPVGHYEKMLKHVEEYIWVPGDKPSGYPGAFLVSEDEALGKKGFQ